MRRRLLGFAMALVLVTVSVVAAVALSRARVAFETEHNRSPAIGDCVVITAPSPNIVQTRRASCADDPSYIIGAMADATGTCPASEYQHFPGPAADRVTASLCLVPNLVADHCYRLGMPIGVIEPAECSAPRTGGPDTGVLVQVRQRLDVHDQRACPSEGGTFAWPYPSPARTYCTSTLY